MEISTPSVCSLRRSCPEISIRQFKKAQCNNDLYVLVLTGEATPEQLHDAWLDVMSDYSNRVRTEESDYVLHTAWQIGLLQAEIIYTEQAVFHLRIIHRIEFVDELNKMGYGPLNYTQHDEDWQRQLNRVISLMKTKVFDLEQLCDEYKRLQNTTEGKQLTEAEFDKNVSMLGKYQGYHLNQDTMMMDEYLSILNNYITEYERMKKQTH